MSFHYIGKYLQTVCNARGSATVAVRRVPTEKLDSVRKAMVEVIDASAASGTFAQWRHERVLLKPNFCRVGRRGETTSVVAIEAAVQILLDYECEVLLADGMTQAFLPPRNLKGFEEVALRLCEIEKRYGIPFIHLNEGRETRWAVEADGFVFHLPSCLRDAAGLLNLAVLKVHPQMVGSYAVKNLMGLLSGPDRLELHRTGIAEGVWRLQASVAKAVPMQFHFVDGLLSFQGYDAPIGCVEPRLVLGGTNPCAVDFACAQVMGIDPDHQFPQHSIAVANGFAHGAGSSLIWNGPSLAEVRFRCHIPDQVTKTPPTLPSVRIHWGMFSYPMNCAVKDLMRFMKHDLPLDIYVGGAVPTVTTPSRWSVLLGNASMVAYHGSIERVVRIAGDPPAGDTFQGTIEWLTHQCPAAKVQAD